MVVFASISPHPPVLLPNVGTPDKKDQVKSTIQNLNALGNTLKKKAPDEIIISSPHTDWGYNVPLYFLAPDFQGKIHKYLTGSEEPYFHFEEGKKIYHSTIKNQKTDTALIASGDLSHRLMDGGPDDFHPEGPVYDKELIDSLKYCDIKHILNLTDIYPNAGECGHRSFCYLLGILEAQYEETSKSYSPEILSYEAPFGVGYLVAEFKL